MATTNGTAAKTDAKTDAKTGAKTARPVAKTATPWGVATVVERLSLAQRAGEKRFSSIVELLENERGERLVRFAYTTGGAVRRGPVTLRLRDVERLRDALPRQAPELAAALGLAGGEGQSSVGGGA
jgi:hypothetical protein